LGLPLALPLVVEVTDAEQQKSRLAYLVPVEVSPR
jgi:hypothetical protein